MEFQTKKRRIWLIYFLMLFSVIACALISRGYRHPMLHSTKTILKLRTQYNIGHNPICSNVLTNLTSGRWMLMSPGKEDFYDNILLRYWRKRGILKHPWRKDNQCGFFRYQSRMENSTWNPVGSWCNPHSNKPCCNNMWSGTCIAANATSCTCKGCVDSRNYHHAETSRWVTQDQRCRWTNYTGAAACNVVENSPFHDIVFVGDSFMRNMFLTFLMLLSDDPWRGAWNSSMTPAAKEICISGQMYFWKECRQILTQIGDVYNKRSLCGGKEPAFNVTMKPFYNMKFQNDFLELVKSLLGKQGALIIVGVGYHMQCMPDIVIGDYLRPAVQAINKYYEHKFPTGRWPQIFFMVPMPVGLLKSPVHFPLQNDNKIAKLTTKLRQYCAIHNIPLFDFRKLGKFVHSFDGTHFGLGVNLMKNQVLLNYIASLHP